ncbi:hypothetical protein ACQPXH_27295 [Nocardia sp. CA-135953]|uniref:hypothetical protein n=1 Tax=Nocardia sp. CA-135953 TaxID=3239978 RepID=UPI003D95B0ED
MPLPVLALIPALLTVALLLLLDTRTLILPGSALAAPAPTPSRPTSTPPAIAPLGEIEGNLVST